MCAGIGKGKGIVFGKERSTMTKILFLFYASLLYLVAVGTVGAKTPVISTASKSCPGKVKLLVPLYVYPGASVAASASSVGTVAIINPNSGPAPSPDSSYLSYMQKLNNAKVELVGYVHTSYGSRNAAEVKAEIDTYATKYPNLKGIFLDEASTAKNMVSYYTSLHNYILAKPGWTHNIINPGIVPDAGYVNASTQIVTFEDYGTDVAAATKPSFASCNNAAHFAAIAHTVTSSSMHSIVDGLLGKNYLGYLYVTDGAGGCCTYNTLTSYYSSLASYIASKQ